MKILLSLLAGFISFSLVQPDSFGGALIWVFLAWPLTTLVVWAPFLLIAGVIGAAKRKNDGV